MGANWAGYNSEQDAYDWDPVTIVPGLVEADVLGLEAPLWTLVLSSVADMDYLAFPRLPGHAEIAWSPQAGRSWDEYRTRLASHGPRLSAWASTTTSRPASPGGTRAPNGLTDRVRPRSRAQGEARGGGILDVL